MTFRITYSVLEGDRVEIDRAFDEALASVVRAAPPVLPSWVNGEAIESGDLLVDTSPADMRRVLARVHRAPIDVIPRAVDAAREAQRAWAATPWAERNQRLLAAADLLSERRFRCAAIMSLEVGKTRLESLGDVEEAADLLRYYAGQIESAGGFDRPLGMLSPRENTRDVLRPYGLFAVLSPFNFPMALAAGMAGAALLAGNAVILKPSEQTPWCAELLFEAFRDAGIPRGVFQVLHGEGESVGAALARHPGIDGVAFTGSTQVGRDLHRVMSTGRIRPALLELGGKNATIVTASADLDAAAQGCVRSAFGLSGQKCSALSRIYVARSIHDAFLARLVERTSALVVGDPADTATFVGPVIDARAVERFVRATSQARTEGVIHVGGTRLDAGALAHGHFVAPTIVSVPRGHRLVRDELFLPFVAVAPFDTFDEAITLVNDVDFGLTAGIFGNDASEIDAFMDRVEAGVLYANRETGATTGAWPGVQSFCGWKGSGSTGKGGCGPYYVAQFAREQSQTRMTQVIR